MQGHMYYMYVSDVIQQSAGRLEYDTVTQGTWVQCSDFIKVGLIY